MKFILTFIIFSQFSITLSAQVVRMETVLGDIDILLHSDSAPNAVDNFLTYMNDGDYNNSIIHRKVNNFVVQGGGFKFVDGVTIRIPSNGPIDNEYSLPNVRGSIAMAKPANNPNGATSEWFFNTIDNTDTLGPDDPGNAGSGGFTVFGTIISGIEVVDAINALQSSTVSNPVNIVVDGTVAISADVPYLNERPETLQEEDAVIISNVMEIEFPLTVNSGLNGAWFNSATSGQGLLFEMLPSLNQAFMAWFTYDTVLPDSSLTATIGSAGHRWVTGLGSIDFENNSIIFDLTLTSGGIFDNNQAVINSPASSYGTLTINFTDCSNATAEYDFIAQGLSGSFPLTRISSANVDLCESLSIAAITR